MPAGNRQRAAAAKRAAGQRGVGCVQRQFAGVQIQISTGVDGQRRVLGDKQRPFGIGGHDQIAEERQHPVSGQSGVSVRQGQRGIDHCKGAVCQVNHAAFINRSNPRALQRIVNVHAAIQVIRRVSSGNDAAIAGVDGLEVRAHHARLAGGFLKASHLDTGSVDVHAAPRIFSQLNEGVSHRQNVAPIDFVDFEHVPISR